MLSAIRDPALFRQRERFPLGGALGGAIDEQVRVLDLDRWVY
jgi:hypothetical protein